MREKLWICVGLMTFTLACGKQSGPPAEKPSAPEPLKVVVEEEKREKKPPPPPEVKIRLKKDGKDQYSWELSGSDVDQILKVDEKLRKKLGEPSK
jgi:hypothetical protein